MKKIYFVYMALIGFVIVSCKSNSDVTPPEKQVIDSVKTGLLAYYPFNGNANDLTGRGNDGAVSGATLTADRFGNANAAYKFDGTSSFIKVNDSPDLHLYNTDFTITLWANLDSYNTNYGNVLLGKRTAGTAQGWVLGIAGTTSAPGSALLGFPFYQVSDSTDPIAIGTKGLKSRQWHMLTVVYDYTKKLLGYYIDGILINSTENIPSPANLATTPLFIGADSENATGGAATQNFTKGSIDDVRIYGRVITQDEVTSLYNLPK